MSTLVVLIPPRLRLRAGGEVSAPATAPGQWRYALSADGMAVQRDGEAGIALLPRADTVVAVLDAGDVSWHRLTLPRGAQSRMAAALAGMLEDALLDEPARLHAAVAPGAKAGESCWIAATDRDWLAGEIATLERAGLRIDRVVPSAWPDHPPALHIDTLGMDRHGPRLRAVWAHAEGVSAWPMTGGLARALVPNPLPPDTRCSATPAAVGAAESWLGPGVRVIDDADHALAATRSLWNLRQFGLAARHRGVDALQVQWRRFLGTAWRPVRYGLIGLALVWLAGLNLAAWQQREQLSSKRQQMTALLQNTHPHVRAVLDAPAQMQRETETLRAAAGRPGEADLEPALQAAASAWPMGQPVPQLNYETGQLVLTVPGWSEDQIAIFRDTLRPAGWLVESVDGRVTLRHAPATLTAGGGL
jgi:general secretion pathway protein L